MTIAHISDIHFGRIAFPQILDALVKDVEDAEVDLVAVGGDLTQRALHSQFKKAADFLKRFTSPLVVVPGNHDVFPWWRPFMRVEHPVARFKKYFGDEMVRPFVKPGLSFLGINSAHGKTIKGGIITSAIRDAITSFFDSQPADSFKVLMLHHHLVPLAGLSPHDICQNGPAAMIEAAKVGVQLVLSGHMHVSHNCVSHVETLPHSIEKFPVVASAGTATSDRGRRTNRGKNLYNLIKIRDNQFEIEERVYDPSSQKFDAEKLTQYKR